MSCGLLSPALPLAELSVEPVEELEWRREWVFRLLVELNRLLHTSHWCGFSPVWTRWCFWRWASWVKLLVQTSQWKGRSPVCVRKCTFKFDS